MIIEETPLQHWIDHYYGYGSWNAPIWFVSYEESGGDLPEEVADKINYFYREFTTISAPTLCDVRELYRHVMIRWEGPKAAKFSNLYDYRFGEGAVQHGIWKNLIAFIHGFRNENLPDLINYQRNTFASSSAHDVAMLKLFPLPASNHHAWYYSWLELPRFDYLKSRTLYEQHIYQGRMHTILDKIRTHKPVVVLMYGMNNINLLKSTSLEFFPDGKFKMIKSTKREIPQHHRADLNGTTMLITTQIPALHHNRVETGFDWLEFGRTLGK